MQSELTQIIHAQAHDLAATSFAVIRLRLRKQARAMLKQGIKLDEVLRAIPATGLPSDTPKPLT
jgi:hypothetical protein